jgi:hypothetical protein
VPLLVATVGGWGNRSTYAKRNASGQSVNELNALGESERGGTSAMSGGYTAPVTVRPGSS